MTAVSAHSYRGCYTESRQCCGSIGGATGSANPLSFLRPPIVNGIHSQYKSSRDRLLYVLVEFLKQVKPTWGAIVNALKSPAINHRRLALKIESKYCLPAEPMQPLQPPLQPAAPQPQPRPQSASSDSPRSLTSTPTVADLLNFKIVHKIGTDYIGLGTMLLNDDTGALTQSIASQHQRNPFEINWAILTRWLQGQGKKPVQWSTLIEVLKDIELSELAQKIKDNL